MAGPQSSSVQSSSESEKSERNRRFSALSDLIKVCENVKDSKTHRSLINLIGLSALDAFEGGTHRVTDADNGTLPQVNSHSSRSQNSNLRSNENTPLPMNIHPALGRQVLEEKGASPKLRRLSVGSSHLSRQSSKDELDKEGISPMTHRRLLGSQNFRQTSFDETSLGGSSPKVHHVTFGSERTCPLTIYEDPKGVLESEQFGENKTRERCKGQIGSKGQRGGNESEVAQ